MSLGPVTILHNAAQSGVGAEISALGDVRLVVYIIGSSDAVGGSLQLEHCHAIGYPGNWWPEGDPIAVVPNSCIIRQYVGGFRAIRMPFVDNMTGGSVIVEVMVVQMPAAVIPV